MAKREKFEHAEELRWGQVELLLKFPEQVEYERIRPPIVFGGSVAERARQTGTPETTLRRRIAGFESEGMRSLPSPRAVPLCCAPGGAGKPSAKPTNGGP